MECPRNSNNKNSIITWKFSKFAPILAGALFMMNPSGANAQNTSNQIKAKAEISTSTILDRLNQKVGVSLPDEYNGKVLDFVLNDTIMRTRSATAYTEEFIINEMKKNWGISKENQLLFIRSSIYGGISENFLYDRLDDDNEARSNEYEKALKQIAASYEEYKRGFKTYMDIKSAEYDKRSADAQQRSADAQQRSADAQQRSAKYRAETLENLNISLNAMKDYYNYRKEDPSLMSEKDLNEAKADAKKTIQMCKDYGVDYKSILSPEILKFYGVE